MLKKIDNYVIFLDKKLGEGSFGKVYIGEQNQTHIKVAIKMLEKSNIDKYDHLKKSLMLEIEILKILRSENIVEFIDVMESSNFYYIIQEFCQGGDLQCLMEKRKKFPEKEAVEMIKQICNGFVEILKQGITHRDLKPANILIKKGVIKIADFGLSKKNHSKNWKHHSHVGTPLYSPLQILKSTSYTSKCDIWAIGIIFYQLLHGFTPYKGNSEYELIQSIDNQKLKFLVDLSDTTKDFITRCLEKSQQDRISWDQLFRHQMFNGYFSQYLNPNYKFENKLKSLMNEIRGLINEQNIDLQRLFQSRGYSKQTELTFENFQQFLKTIDSTLTPQQQRYIFQKIDIDQSNTISLDQLQKQLIKHNISMKAKKTSEQKRKSIQNHKTDPLRLKVIIAFKRLNQIMQKNKVTLVQVFSAYDVNKDGDLSIIEFSKIMNKLDSTFTDNELKLSFGWVDTDDSGTITLQQFEKYFCKTTGLPFKNYMKELKGKQKENENNIIFKLRTLRTITDKLLTNQ